MTRAPRRPAPQPPSSTPRCGTPGCDRPAGETGYCHPCWRRRYAHGDRHRITTDAAHVRQHILEHLRRGVSQRHLARQAGVSHTTVGDLASGTRDRVSTTVAQRLLGMPLPNPSPGRCPSNVGCTRRVDSLRATGYRVIDIARAAGLKERGLFDARARGSYSDRAAAGIGRAWDTLRGTLGPDRRAAITARRRGAVPAWAWDGVDIDDPRAVPNVPGPAGRPPDVRPFFSPYYFYAQTGRWPTRGVA